MDHRGTQSLNTSTNGSLAGSPSSAASTSIQQARGTMANNGGLVLARENFTILQINYLTYAKPKRNLVSTSILVRNLRKIHLDVLSKATPGTGIWFLKTDKFLLWMDPDGNLKILWGTGIPGAGKSVLASIVIRELEARAAAAGGSICVCYIYFRYSDNADLTVRDVLKILIKQMVERHPEFTLLVEATYPRDPRENAQPTEPELLNLLQQLTRRISATFYILDALDELRDRLQVDLVRKLASLNARLFITSRPMKFVQDEFPDAHCFPIVVQDGDLNLHIAWEISRSRELQGVLERTGSSFRDELVSLVKSKCSGMFLHASLQLDTLHECVTAYEVRQTLEMFPSNIEGVYRQTWHRILGQRQFYAFLAKYMLVWVLNAPRSMSIKELEYAVATSPDTHKFEPNRLVPGTTLIALCRGLVMFEEESRQVRLVHYTAKHTLQGLLSDSFPYPHSLLAAVCMTHLRKCGFQNTTIRSEEDFTAARLTDPLLAYASDAWDFHARHSLEVEETRQRIAHFVSECRAFPAFTKPDLLGSFDLLSPRHILANYNLPISLIAHNDIDDPNVLTPNRQESPLTLAAYHDHEDLVASFLAHPKIQVNRVDNEGWSVLMLAAREGHGAIVELLLAHPEIKVNLMDLEGRSALMLAIYHGHEGVVKYLMAHPSIQVNLVLKNAWSALMLAASRGHVRNCILLLAHPEVQVNLTNEEGGSALMLAAYQGHESSCKVLLAHPEIQVNLVNEERWSALMLAAYQGHEGSCELLLAHPGTQVNLTDKKGLSALILAAGKGHEATVKFLLAHPEIQVNLVDRRGWSALMNAAANGRQGTITLLLGHRKIQVDLVDKEGWSALMLAADGGHGGVVRLLLDVPDITTTTKETDNGYTAMALALAHRHTGIVRLLQEFDLRPVNRNSRAMCFENMAHLGRFTLREVADEGVSSGSDSEGSEIYEDAQEWLGSEDTKDT